MINPRRGWKPTHRLWYQESGQSGVDGGRPATPAVAAGGNGHGVQIDHVMTQVLVVGTRQLDTACCVDVRAGRISQSKARQ